MNLSDQDLFNRYKRHILLEQIGEVGQRNLLESKVLIVGLGGLGCPAAQYLAAAGVGTLGLCDFDKVEESNLQRQILYSQDDIGKPKVQCAQRRLSNFDSNLNFKIFDSGIQKSFEVEKIKQFDVVLDATDNFDTRYLLNKLCDQSGVPLIYGAIHKFEGQVSVFDSKIGPCYNCIFPEKSNQGFIPDCEQAGVLGALPGIIGTIEAIEALKVILVDKLGSPLVGKLLIYDALCHESRKIKLKKDQNCSVCSNKRKEKSHGKVSESTYSLKTVSAQDLATLKKEGKSFKLVDVRKAEEHVNARIPGSIHLALEEFFALEEFILENPSFFSEEEEIILYCQSGARSKLAALKLLEHGYSKVSNLVGGFMAWQMTEQ